ncbi:hypothetical protein DFH07DRAFT_839874 [Mycena maculata]|uniref:GATA-type domain-containing protein n=1 Tax=Mycena maculata TaxID=230809 RepID=A0AAD7IC21_9AGAR|nr:hypothetical protein DFH07DRAFT_839874 [Mycena maculata]
MAHPTPPPKYYPASAPSPENVLPAVGQTRCYWALLSTNLQFIYLDPVLAHHLESEAPELVGKSLVSFVHPDEQASAQQDLGSVLESRTLHGSVTRVRFSRLSRVRRELGYQGPPSSWSDADKISLDSNYMAVDIVINWAAEGVVLCFIHAIVDLNPSDNDETHKTGWTNWCGTPVMNDEQVQLLFRRLVVCVPQAPGLTNRVFQILSNRPNRPLLVSWPPDQGQGPSGRDFAKLVEDVAIGPGAPTGNEAKTSCTRRYKALQTMPAVAGEVESIFIPHGSVIFACHKVNSPSRSTATTPTTMQQIAYNTPSYSGQTPYYEQQNSSYALPPLSAPPAPYNYLAQSAQPSSSVSAPYSPPRWAQGEQPTGTYGGQWPSSSSQGHSTSNLRSGSYPPPQGQQWPSQPPSYVDTNTSNGPTYQRPLSPTYGYASPADETNSPATDSVPPPRRRISPGSTRESGGRNGGIRPQGVLKCSSCKATTSPEWRKGPSGKKELCNACGLRYARSRAKKEGNQTQRKRKEKGPAVKRGTSATPPSATSSNASYSAIRRNYDDSSFSSAGSGSGSDAYPRLDDSTPSPSPPASNMNFVHYSPGDNHPNYQASSANAFYSVPSPLSNPPVQSSASQPSYTGRASPMNSPAAHSPLTSTAPSFERERERDLLPPTPISAEPRHVRRSILTQQ